MDILFLAHRIPFPPNRGDKMRSWHVLKHLGRYGTVHLGAFADDEVDAAHLAGLREAMGGALGEAYVEPRQGKRLGRTAAALLRGESLAVAAFDSSRMRAFAGRMLAQKPIAAIYAFSVQMAQFVPARTAARFIMDFVDLDSAKYADYGARGLSPMRVVHRREGATLLAFERATAARADLGLFVSDAEADLFRRRAGPVAAEVRALPNGIDLAYYDPQAGFAPPDRLAGPLIAFTGQMDYRPNVEAVLAFASEVLPRIRAARPDVRFAIVGRRPVPAVARLAARGDVIVTGEVADVRPWLAAAALVVAPLAIARGVQNKVLEAMAMARPVVASPAAFTGIDAEPGRDLIVADGAVAQAEAALALLGDAALAARMGGAARRRMVAYYSWEAQLAPLAGWAGLAPLEAAA